jgi:trans-aconitate methyltransferase
MRHELHRTFFGLLSKIPGPLGSELTRGVFEWKYSRPDPWVTSDWDYQHQKYRATLEHVPERSYRNILDAGCGEGDFIEPIRGAYPDARIMGVDISSRAIARAKEHSGDKSNVEFRTLDILRQRMDARFDLIFCTEVVYYVDPTGQGDQLVRQLTSMLSSGGALILVNPWPEARRLHQQFSTSDELSHLADHVHYDERRSFVVSIYEQRELGPEERQA